MKNIKTLVPVLIMIFLISCGNFSKDKTVLCERIQYDVIINNPDPGHYWWVNNIEGSKREPFIKNLFNAAFLGEVKAYDYFNNLLSVEQLKMIGADTIYRTLTRPYAPYDEYDTVIITKLEYEDVKRIRFLEEWLYDENEISINKKVVGIAPLIERKDGEGNMIAVQPLFWLYFDEKYPLR
ncbi:MAG: hypothetical protein K8R41_08405 [Bacteroidales bacterium]|nr:hypothetical protein [Bacteroidales bacterium]